MTSPSPVPAQDQFLFTSETGVAFRAIYPAADRHSRIRRQPDPLLRHRLSRRTTTANTSPAITSQRCSTITRRFASAASASTAAFPPGASTQLPCVPFSTGSKPSPSSVSHASNRNAPSTRIPCRRGRHAGPCIPSQLPLPRRGRGRFERVEGGHSESVAPPTPQPARPALTGGPFAFLEAVNAQTTTQ